MSGFISEAVIIESKYEIASIIGKRALELFNNSPPLLPLPLPLSLVDPIEIAQEELRRGLLKPHRKPFTHASATFPA
jgi:DNA-directed RNA polymerase subunit K/omega